MVQFFYIVVAITTMVASAVHHPCTSFETCGALYSKEYLHDVYYSGLRRITKKAKTQYCKQKIEYEFMKHVRALAEESVYPFENVLFESQCKNASSQHPPLKTTGPHVIKLAHNDTISLMQNVTGPVDPDKLAILYIMLVHNHPEFAVRIINALDEPMHHFVIHVDANANEVQQYLQLTLANRTNIHLLEQGREIISWGGFSIVNATLTAMKYAWHAKLTFDYLIDISGTTYPLKSNRFIRTSLAASPNAVYMETYPTPVRPEGVTWNQFVECDGALHRIARLPQPRGINMHVSSQWFAVPRHYVYWLLHSALGRDYIHYAQYIIIADENYFATMFHNSPYCQADLRRNLVFLLFDKWEHERNTTETGRPRDSRKCLGVGENNCGRSPTTLTMDFKNLLGASRMLFARKFDPENASSMRLVDFIDNMRNTYGNTSAEVTDKWDSNKDDGTVSTMIRVGLDGPHSSSEDAVSPATTATTLLESAGSSSSSTDSTSEATADQNTAGTAAPVAASAKCLAYTAASPGYIRQQPCDPADPKQWFEIGRCTFGYALELRDGQCPTFRKLGNNSITANTTVNTTEAGGEGPVEEGEKEDIFCAILTRGLEDKELCVDIAGENPAYRTPVLGYDCTGRWNQMFRLTENCTIMAEQPSVISRVRSKSDKAIVSCLDARHDSGVILTAECENLRSDLPLAGSMQQASNHTVEAAATEGATATVGVSASGEASPSQVQNATLGGRTAVPAVNWQLFQFMPASGTAFKAYMGGVGDSSSRGGEGVDNTLQQ